MALLGSGRAKAGTENRAHAKLGQEVVTFNALEISPSGEFHDAGYPPYDLLPTLALLLQLFTACCR
jgi:hypothetical protein